MIGHPLLPSVAPAAGTPAEEASADRPLPPGSYSSDDPSLFWLSNRPYKITRLLGKGGFGEVHEVEMLIPKGLEVVWTDKGEPELDQDG